ncbi:MAG: inorganic diphosphatase [Rhodospirillales bacterium]|nr:inorganic diphosphatase [Acetobacter sp.]
MPAFERFRPHPWHGLSPGRQPPRFVQVFVETTPFDAVKYEVDRVNGYLRVNRLQRTSSLPPALYGFIPQTLSGERVGALTPEAKGGDGDPLDICVFSERPIRAVEVVLDARVLGGLRILDAGEADDKIVAVLENDPLWGEAQTLDHLPALLIERLEHYFCSYKAELGKPASVQVLSRYGPDEAQAVINAALADYRAHFPQTNAVNSEPPW